MLQGTKRDSFASSLTRYSGIAPNRKGQDKLVHAIHAEDIGEVEKQLQEVHVDPNFFTNFKDWGEECCPIHIAAESGNLAVIEILIHWGAIVNCFTQKQRRTPL